MTIIDTTQQAAPTVTQDEPGKPPSPTGRWVVILFLVASAAVLVARAATLSDALVPALPDEIRADLGDSGLERLAVGVGIILGLVVTLLAQVIFLWLARLLERHMFSASLGSGRLRVGLFSAVVMVAMLTRQAWSLLAGGPVLEPPPYAVAVAAASALLTLVLYLPRLRLLTPGRVALVSGTAVLIAVLTSVG